MERKQKVLFLRTQNSARSQMAEAILTHHAGDRFEAYSAGCEAADEIHPYVREVMNEVGIDTSEQHSKGLKTYMGKVGFSYSIVVCARAEKNCSKTFPGVGTRLVRAFEDPRGEDIPEEERPVPCETLTVPDLARPLVGVSLSSVSGPV